MSGDQVFWWAVLGVVGLAVAIGIICITQPPKRRRR